MGRNSCSFCSLSTTGENIFGKLQMAIPKWVRTLQREPGCNIYYLRKGRRVIRDLQLVNDVHPITRVIGRIPNRLALAGGWLDQPFVSRHTPEPPGSMVVVILQPT